MVRRDIAENAVNVASSIAPPTALPSGVEIRAPALSEAALRRVPYLAGVRLRRLTYRRGNPLVCEWEIAHAQTERMRHRICDCRRRGTLRGFARAGGG